MALTFYGNDLSTLTRIKSSEARRNADGTMGATVTWAIKTSEMIANLPERGVTEHPDWSDFKADLWSASTPIQGVTLLTIYYVSVITVSLVSGDPLPLDVEEEAGNVVSEEPITTAANFLVSAGGLDPIVPLFESNGTTSKAWPTTGSPAYSVTVDPSTGRWPVDGSGKACIPGNRAVFDTFGQNKDPLANDYNPNVGRFLYFGPGSPFVGLESYLIPRGEWAFSYSTDTQPNLSDVGKIGTPPGLPAPSSPINYLLTSMRYRRTGAVYRVTQTWRRSGPRGWSSKIYSAI